MRKQLYSILLVVNALAAFGQRGGVGSSSVSYSPSGDGYAFSGAEVKYQFINCYGEVQVMIDWSGGSEVITNYHYNGSTYRWDDLPADVKPSITRVKISTITADVYYGSARLGSVTLNYTIGNFAGCFGETYKVLEMTGNDSKDKRYKEGIDQLRLLNIRVASGGDVLYRIHDYLRNKEKEADYNKYLQSGDSKMASKDYEGALADYNKAQNAKSTPELTQKIEAAKNAKNSAAKAEKANELEAEGDALMAEGNYGGAISKYEAAKSANPEDATVASKLSDAKNKKEEAELKAQEEAKQKSQQDSTTAAEESAKTSEDEESAANSSDNSTSAEEEAAEAQRRAEQEEFERRQREAQYWENRNAAIDRNTAAAAELGASALMVHYFIGEMLYSGMGNDRKENLYEAPSFAMSILGGYSLSSIPMFFNSSYENYDGNNYSYTNKTEDYQSFMLELGGGVEFWPVYSPEMGLGGSVYGYAGHGILLQQFTYGYSLGLMGHLGGKKMQVYGEYSNGWRGTYYTPWIDPGEAGSGTSEFTYDRIAVGPQFRFSDSPVDWSTLQLLGVLERDYEVARGNVMPTFLNWSKGMRIAYSSRNSFQVYGEVIFQYRRTGTTEYSFADDATFNGTFFRAGFLRRWDVYGPSALSIRSVQQAQRALHSFNNWEISFAQPFLGWLRSDAGYTTQRFDLGMAPIGVHKNIKLYGPISLRIGLDANFRTTPSGFGENKTTTYTVGGQMPVGIRYWIPAVVARYYGEFGRTLQYDFYSTREDDGLPATEAFYNGWHAGFGLAIPDPGGATAVGLRWFQSSTPILETNNVRPSFLTITIGREF